MDRMVNFKEDEEPVSLEVEPADELEVKVELTNQPKPKQDPFLPKKADRAEAFKPPKDKKPLSEKQKAHLERLRQKKIALKEKRAEMADVNSKEARKERATAKKQEKSVAVEKAPVYPTALEGPSESEEEEEPPTPPPKRKAKPKKVIDDDTDFEKFITNLDKFEKMKKAVDDRERKIREKEEAKERALEAKIRAKIDAENKQRNNRNGNFTQPVPKTQSLLQTPQGTDYGIYSNRYF